MTKTIRMIMKPTINKYQNNALKRRLNQKLQISQNDINDLFSELKKWLWISAESILDRKEGRNAPVLFIDEPLLIIDIVWHEFILFTKDYKDFTENLLGVFVHHQPADPNSSNLMRREEFLLLVEDQYSYIYDKLGESTLKKWYQLYPQKYSPEQIQKIISK